LTSIDREPISRIKINKKLNELGEEIYKLKMFLEGTFESISQGN